MKHLLPLLLLSVASVHAQEVVFSSDFEDEATVKNDWSAQGSDPTLAIISTSKAASGKQSLAIEDSDSTKYAAWQSRAIDLPQSAIDKGMITVSWKILYSVPNGQTVRFSIFFEGAKEDKSTKHYNLKGDSEGWTAGQFTEQRYDVPIPPNATQIRLKLASNVGGGSDGTVYLDDIKVED